MPSKSKCLNFLEICHRIRMSTEVDLQSLHVLHASYKAEITHNPYLTHINEYRLGQIASNHIKRKNPGIAIIPGF